MSVVIGEQQLSIFNGNTSSSFYYFWLRDHCRCDACYNHETFQRKSDIGGIDIDIKPNNWNLAEDKLQVTWPDGHKSEYPLAWLQGCSYENFVKKNTRDYKLWSLKDVPSLPIAHVQYDDLLASEVAVEQLTKSLVDFGVGFVEKVPADVASTEKAVLRLSHVQHTLFGGMWEFSDKMDHSDTAYTREELRPHTDNTYFTEAAGLQILHCLEHSGEGGENMLVDGFKVLDILKKEHPDVYGRLLTTLVEAEYLEEGFHHKFCAPIIKLNSVTGQFEQIRYNVNDRAPTSLPTPQILQFYKDLKLLNNLINNPKMEWYFKLKPGTVLFFDNFRVLHGRSQYTGHRKMCGCYVGRSDFLSKARTYGLLSG